MPKPGKGKIPDAVREAFEREVANRGGPRPQMPQPEYVQLTDPIDIALNQMIEQQGKKLGELFTELGNCYAMLSLCRSELRNRVQQRLVADPPQEDFDGDAELNSGEDEVNVPGMAPGAPPAEGEPPGN